MKPVFKLPHLQKEFEANGYVLLDALGTEEINTLKYNYECLPEVNNEGFFASLYSDSGSYKQKSFEAISAIANKIAEKYLDNYISITATYVTKKRSENSYMPPHQDWTIVDETQYASVNIWFPLVPVNKENGALYVLKGSHKLPSVIRGTLIPSAFNYVTNMTFDHLTYLPMKPGEIIIFDHRLIHASPPNQSDAIRLAITALTVPKGIQLLHYFNNPETQQTEKYEITPDFFNQYTYGKYTIPKSAKYLETIQLDNPNFTNVDTVPLLEALIVADNRERKSFIQKIKNLLTFK